MFDSAAVLTARMNRRNIGPVRLAIQIVVWFLVCVHGIPSGSAAEFGQERMLLAIQLLNLVVEAFDAQLMLLLQWAYLLFVFFSENFGPSVLKLNLLFTWLKLFIFFLLLTCSIYLFSNSLLTSWLAVVLFAAPVLVGVFAFILSSSILSVNDMISFFRRLFSFFKIFII